MKAVYYVFGVVFLLSRCMEPGVTVLNLKNDYENKIAFFSADNTEEYNYPDTLLPNGIPYMGVIGRGGIMGCFAHKTHSWKQALDFYTKSKVLSVYIFDYNQIKDMPWEDVRDNYNILSRYDLRASDIDMCWTTGGWLITFPPNEKMKNIHMWPPYDEIVSKYGTGNQ